MFKEEYIMKRFLYLIGFLVFFLVLKAFYIDPYIAEHYGETNTTSEVNQTENINTSQVDQPVVKQETNTSHGATREFAPKEKLPIDQLGDSIANKLQDKIGKH